MVGNVVGKYSPFRQVRHYHHVEVFEEPRVVPQQVVDSLWAHDSSGNKVVSPVIQNDLPVVSISKKFRVVLNVGMWQTHQTALQ